MATVEDIANTKKNISQIFQVKRVKLFALSLSYAGQAINKFRSFQDGNVFWDNQTDQAKDRMFSNAFMEKETIGWFLSHGVSYGIYLETANDRQNEAIKPIIEILAPAFFREARNI